MKRKSDVDVFLNVVNSHHNYRSMMQKFTLETFVSLECWPTLQRELSGYLVVWLHTKPLLHSPMMIRANLSYMLTFGKLHYLYRSSLALGYLIEFPKIRMEVTDTYLMCSPNKRRVSISKIDDLEPLGHIFGDSHLAAFTLGNNQLLACTNKQLVDFLK